MQQDPIEIIQQLYEAFRHRDFSLIFAFMAPEIEISQSPELPWGGVYVGHEGLRRFAAKLTEQIDSFVEPERYIKAGDHVVAIGRLMGKVRANGRPFDVPVVHVWQYRAGQIVRFQPYIDNAAMLVALHVPHS